MSRPRFEPSDPQRQLVKTLAAYGIGQEEIAGKIGATAKTLRKHFRKELDCGAMEANRQVIQTLFNMAKGGKHLGATIFWFEMPSPRLAAERDAHETATLIIEAIQPTEPSK